MKRLDNSSEPGTIAAALRARGHVRLRVFGGSMLPWVRPGDIVAIRSATPESVRCGDVILFGRSGRLFVHRVLSKEGAADGTIFFTKGDAHPGLDAPVEQEELLGRVVQIHRRGRSINLETPGQMTFGILISQLSARSSWWYPLARLAARAFLSFYRLFNPPGASQPESL